MEVEPEVAGEVSPGLSRLLRAVIDDPERTQEATLGVVLEHGRGGLIDRLVRLRRLDPRQAPSVAAELEALIDRYGSEAAAESFVRYRGSAELTTLIRTVMDERGSDRPPTLGMLREAVDSGTLARLEGEGALDGDEDNLLRTELERLIELHGSHALAEEII